MNLVEAPHHDGSALYVERRDWRVGGSMRVRVHVPNESGFVHAAVRYVHDGEQGYVSLVRDHGDSAGSWWSAEVPLVNPVVSYRFVLATAAGTTQWLNATGVHKHDTPDADDFVARCDISYPDWPTKSVVYQIFPDRFATSGLDVATPSWARRREWSDLPQGPDWSSELFGGDLYGAAEHLDHVAQLGANVVYFTPVFTARSAHRYDAATFEEVDPLLGGDAGLAALAKQAHAWNMRVLGDLTLNHCGSSHAWYQRAISDEKAPEREYFYFEDTADGKKPATWLGVSSLIKLNFGSDDLRDRMYAAQGSVARRWLDEESGLDGWRIDVANMAGRRGAHDVSHEVSDGFVAACREENAEVYVVGEHFPDPRVDMVRGGWHGIMAYSAFTRPVWSWLRADVLPAGFPENFFGTPFGVPQRDGAAMVGAMRAFTAGVPFDAVLRSWLILDSHDTPRFHVLTGNRERTKVGVGLQMTLPGVPMVWMGDEIAVGGTTSGEDSRRPMPWDRKGEWDEDLHSWYRECIRLRRGSDALAAGSMRWLHVGPDVVVYLRETASDRVLCCASRSSHAAVQITVDSLRCSRVTTLLGTPPQLVEGRLVLPAVGPGFHAWQLD